MTKKLLLSIYAIMLVISAHSQYPPVFKNSIYGHNPNAGHYANVRGFKMYYEIYGKGEPLLLIHGGIGSINNFSGQIPYFSQHYQVIVVDGRAHGKSVDPTDSLSYEMMAEDFNIFLEFLKIKSCYVIGWSDGGNNGLLLAIHHPDKVKKIILLDPAGYDSEKISGKLAMFKYKEVRQLFDKGMPMFMSWAGIRTAYFKDDLIQEETVIRNNKFTNRQDNLRHMLNLALAKQFPDSSLIQKVQVPTLIVWGKQDEIIPLEHAERFHRDIKGSQLVLFDSCGHCPMMEEPEKTKDVSEKFFKE